MAVPVCGGTERRRSIRPVLSAVFALYGRSGPYNGTCGRSCGTKAVSYTHLDVYKRQVLVGASRVSQLDNSLAALKNTAFSEDELKRIDEILA